MKQTFRVDRLKDLLEVINVRALARETGIHYNTIANWLHGKTVPQRDKLDKLAEWFDIDADWLFETDPFKEEKGGDR